ncbi:MAG: hypothetical protein KA230_08150 [Flavobacteriales bacterium]|nr:hypothetical protein [Flavobacteriales bacterium]
MTIQNLIRLLPVALLLAACGGGHQQGDELLTDGSDSTAAAQDAMKQKTKKIFYSIPSPMETAELLRKAGAEYDKDILNDPNNRTNYTSPSKQAINLGVYGADLSYASVFNQTQESMLFTAAAQSMAKQLGINSVFSDSTMQAMEEAKGDREALLDIVTDTYWNMDGYLKEEGRSHLSALMIAAGWTEGLYIATQVAITKPNDQLRQRIAEQKLSLKDIISLLGEYPQEPTLTSVLGDMQALSAIFEGINVGGATTTSTDASGVTTIGGGSAATITDDQLKTLSEKAASVRNSYIN